MGESGVIEHNQSGRKATLIEETGGTPVRFSGIGRIQ
jgi:hypothetical protein